MTKKLLITLSIIVGVLLLLVGEKAYSGFNDSIGEEIIEILK